MADSGIIYTWSGNEKRYESEKLSISPDKVKFVDFDNYYAEPFIPYIFTPSSHPPDISLEEGTAMYTVGLRNYDIDINNYLTYTPPDGYELVSEDHKNDTGVKDYYVLKTFYCDPCTVYYGTAAKSFTLYLSGGKRFYYKKTDKPNTDTYNKYYVTLSLSNGSLNCQCSGVTNIPGTNNGNVTLSINVQLGDGAGATESISFSWSMKDGINSSKSCSKPYYGGSGFTTRNSWEIDNGDGTKTYYTFYIDRDSIPGLPSTGGGVH